MISEQQQREYWLYVLQIGVFLVNPKIKENTEYLSHVTVYFFAESNMILLQGYL